MSSMLRAFRLWMILLGFDDVVVAFASEHRVLKLEHHAEHKIAIGFAQIGYVRL